MQKKEFNAQCGWNRFGLLLVGLDQYNTDLLGNLYPDNGLIYDTKFLPDKNIMTGRIGQLCGDKPTTWQHPKAVKWAVVRVELIPSNALLLVPEDNIIKFNKGLIAITGDLATCTRYMTEKLKDPLKLYLN